MDTLDDKRRGKQILPLITNHAVLLEYTLEQRIYNLELFKAMVDAQLEFLREKRAEEQASKRG